MASRQTPVLMKPTALEKYLRDHIPLSKAMQVKVVSVDEDAVVLGAPLAPNINHRDTVFGGSASALAILAAWSLLHLRMRHAGLEGTLVLQRNTVDYDKPILGDFTARSSFGNEADWQKFARSLQRKGKARLTVQSVLEHAGKTVGRFSGEFVALTHRK